MTKTECFDQLEVNCGLTRNARNENAGIFQVKIAFISEAVSKIGPVVDSAM